MSARSPLVSASSRCGVGTEVSACEDFAVRAFGGFAKDKTPENSVTPRMMALSFMVTTSSFIFSKNQILKKSHVRIIAPHTLSFRIVGARISRVDGEESAPLRMDVFARSRDCKPQPFTVRGHAGLRTRRS